jgi:hypothetical protein
MRCSLKCRAFTLRSAELSLALRASELLLALPKSNLKARHRTQCFDSHPANHNPLRFSPWRGCSDSTSVNCFAFAAIHRRDPAGIFPPRLRCSAPRTAPLIHESVHPCTTSRCRREMVRLLFWPSLCSGFCGRMPPKTGPPVARRGCAGSVRRRPRTMRGRSLNVHGRTSSEPRSTLAHSQGRMPGERAAGGVFLWLPFFAQAKKVTRSPKASGSVASRQDKYRKRRDRIPLRWNDKENAARRTLSPANPPLEGEG